ncbi:MAG: LutB/LldF family L-lactate oxidation iron-sulfur protein [Chromatiales bacterium]|jgi:L-lactate dehydrogenase complex protein LldF
MRPQVHSFKANAARALRDDQLQQALGRAGGGFIENRARAVEALPEYEALRRRAREIKEHTLDHLDLYLERLEGKVEAAGGRVHWAETAAEARDLVIALCRAEGARRIIKGKSMVGEEIGLNPALEGAGLKVVETDLGEYIIQLAGEPPSHIIAPAVHKSRDQIARLFREHHGALGLTGPLETVASIVDEARRVLRGRFVEADLGITGANFLIAETGSVVLVTNEGNGDLTATLPRTHVVVAGIDKLVPTLEDASVLLRLLGRSATGQEITAYTSWYTGPRRPSDPDGPQRFHLVLVDNGRSAMLDSPLRDMLRCIRCGACMNHCPVYGAVGGHAYGWVYPGPMGSVLTPWLLGLEEAAVLPEASTLCGRCEEVCPMGIPLPSLLRELRFQAFEGRVTPRRSRLAVRAWAALALRPALYRLLTGLGARMLRLMGGRRGRLRRVPLASGWTAARDLPAPEGRTFFARWNRGDDDRP